MDKIECEMIRIDTDDLAISELCLVVQALIDKQAEIVGKVNELEKFVKGLQGLAEKQNTVK